MICRWIWICLTVYLVLIWCYYLLSCLVLAVGSAGLVVGVAVFRILLLVVICLW